jgi:deazaflavin-dependent oxidoreductase (nitroreductase family)
LPAGILLWRIDLQRVPQVKMPERKLTLFERFAISAENLIMMRLSPAGNPGPVLKWMFKVPIFFYKIGLPMFGNFILLLTATGRKSGKLRRTPLEYRLEPGTGCCIITAGWGGNTNWRKNIEANPHIFVQTGRRKFTAVAERLSDEEVADSLAEAVRINPRSAEIWSRWAGEPVSAERPDSFLRAAKFFPSFRLKPIQSIRQNGS